MPQETAGSFTGDKVTTAPILLAHSRFPGWLFQTLKLVFFQIKTYGSNFIKQHSETVMARSRQNADCSFRKKIIVSFIVIFGTLSFPIE